MTQTQSVLRLLRQVGEDGLTPFEALRAIGTFRLAARIAEIRDRDNGYLADDESVDTEMVRRGDANVAKYVLRKRVVTTPTFRQDELW